MITKSVPVTVIGIDPGYDRVGWCIGQIIAGQFQLTVYGCIETTGIKDIIQRFKKIDDELTPFLEKYGPTEAAIETLFFSSNKTTAMRVSEARGVIISCLFRHHVNISEYNPMAMKVAVTGNGKADKSDISRMLHLQFHLPNDKILDDALDAIGMAITHAATRGVSSQLT
ncbi:crossover junction endodeoxyribonuclease RuvC [soil metagenome]